MGCANSTLVESEVTDGMTDKQRSVLIDRMIAKDAKRAAQECKVLLLGSGESGKTTMVKQMKLLYMNGYTEPERKKFIAAINRNIIECAIYLVHAANDLSLVGSFTLENFKFASYLLQYEYQEGTLVKYDYGAYNEERGGYEVLEVIDVQEKIDSGLVHGLQTLWNDPSLPEMESRVGEFYVPDATVHFFKNLDRVTGKNYIPTDEDILYARTKTTGIYETRFQTGNLTFHMFDVGGQRSERRKWIHCFEEVTAILFVTALSEYDQTLLEDETQNRLQESLALFKNIANSRWFAKTALIHFLNKKDIFSKKIPISPFRYYFPEYNGKQDEDSIFAYINNRFRALNKANLPYYPHKTQATDSSNISVIFISVRDCIMDKMLKQIGIF